jgi:AraC-like DNA-binding protein
MIWLDEGGHDRHVRLIAPPLSLREAVEHFWILGARPRSVWRIVPDASAHVIFAVSQQRSGLVGECHVVGARTTHFDAAVAARTVTIGARLRPGALPLLLHDDADGLTDRRVPLDTIFGRRGLELIEQMTEARSETRVQLLARFLASVMKSPDHGLFTPMADAGSVGDVARAMRLSRRGVYDRFLREIGLSPKIALRIRRLHRALLAMNRGITLAGVAVESGYSDQAHFTRDAVHLLGESPAIWRRRSCSFVQDPAG